MPKTIDTKSLVRKVEEVRDREHRLSPKLRLKTEAESVQFIHDMGLVSMLGGNELPSFISAILGRPWKPSGKGFTGWLDWWSTKIDGKQVSRISSEIERRNDVLAVRIFRRTKTFISNKVWPVIDPLVDHNRNLLLKGEMLSGLESKVFTTVQSEGSIRTDRLRTKLNLDGKENNSRFHRALADLESYALIIGAEDPRPEKHLHANIWQTWESRTGTRGPSKGPGYKGAVVKFLQEAIDACVITREDALEKWFRWSTETNMAKEELLEGETVMRVGPYLVSSLATGL